MAHESNNHTTSSNHSNNSNSSSGGSNNNNNATSPGNSWTEPPWQGWIETTGDALLILEAARRGLIPRVTRRLVDSERKMITSGSVFVFDEDESGIKRWTDGFFWSPSRILGNFLLYRETEKRGAGHRSARAEHQVQAHQSGTQHSDSGEGTGGTQYNVDGAKMEGQTLSRPKGESSRLGIDRQRERVLVGSLTNSYKFKPGGMMKKVRICAYILVSLSFPSRPGWDVSFISCISSVFPPYFYCHRLRRVLFRLHPQERLRHDTLSLLSVCLFHLFQEITYTSHPEHSCFPDPSWASVHPVTLRRFIASSHAFIVPSLPSHLSPPDSQSVLIPPEGLETFTTVERCDWKRYDVMYLICYIRHLARGCGQLTVPVSFLASRIFDTASSILLCASSYLPMSLGLSFSLSLA